MSRLSPQPPQARATLVIPQDRPVYQLKSPCYLDNELYPEDAVISWPDAPNPEMMPMNQMASEIFDAYLKQLDDAGRAAAEKAGKAYTSLADAHTVAIQLEQQESKKVGIVGAKKETPLMGGGKKSRVEKIEAVQAAPATTYKGKHSVNETTKGAV